MNDKLFIIHDMTRPISYYYRARIAKNGIYSKLRLNIGKRTENVDRKKIRIEAIGSGSVLPDHTPMLIEITPKYNSFKGSTDKLSSTSKKEREK